MRLLCTILLAATSLFLPGPVLDLAGGTSAAAPAPFSPALHLARLSPLDLEIGGDLAGVPAGATRYVTRTELLALPQETYTVSGDPNFAGPTQISGVRLRELVRYLGAARDADLIVAICGDQYRANYPSDYVEAHDPLLVLFVNGKSPADWPKDAEGHGSDMGPYMISHRSFSPSFKILAHQDEPQIPWGVVRLEFRNAKAVFDAIAPRGVRAAEPQVQDGYRIAQQNCFRCHNMGDDGGRKARRTWLVLSAWAASSPEYFAAYVRNPQASNPRAQMPGNPGYDDATLRALTAYFQTFSSLDTPPDKPQDKP